MMHLDVVGAAEAVTLPGLFAERCRRTADAEAYRQYDAQRMQWRSFTWRAMRVLVGRWCALLDRLGLAAGERAGILLPNGVDWVCFDLAAQSLGAIVVPLYLTDSADNIAHVLADSGARLVLLADTQQWSVVSDLRAQFPALTQVLCMSEAETPDAARGLAWHSVPRLLAHAPAVPEPRLRDAGEIATIVYTSGTTGRPKGVMLSHANILGDAEAVLQRVPSYREDVYLSFLPLSHAFERTAGYYVPMMSGGCVAFARSTQHLAQDLRHVRPTVLIAVPRIYEQAFRRVHEELALRPGFLQRLMTCTVRLGWKRFEWQQHRGPRPGWLEHACQVVLHRAVARRILARFGGRLRVSVSGGATLAPSLSRWFIGIGVPLLQGYGLTEAAPVVSGNSLQDNRPDSVGAPLRGIELKLAPDGEVLVRGPNVMRGYWGLPESTRKAIDAHGWLHTGDLGRLEDGRLVLIGRSKELLVLSTAQKVMPAELEDAITGDPLFAQAMVVGEGRPCLAALLVVDAVRWERLCTQMGLDAGAAASLDDPAVRAAALGRVAAQLANFPAYARVRRVWLTRTPWTIADGSLTPTLKLKREALCARFAAQIALLYAA